MGYLHSILITWGLAFILSSSAFAGKRFDHVVVIVMENADYEDVMEDPYFKALAKKGTVLSNFTANFHPSYPNYLAMVGGSNFDIWSDNQSTVKGTSIVDLLEAKGLTWKAYAEDYPGNCFLGDDSGLYARKHAPLVSFESIQKSPSRCANIVKGEQFHEDWKSKKLPNYSFFTPNMDNDGHDTDIETSAVWLKKFLTPLLADTKGMENTLIEVTYDEGTYFGLNQIYTLFLGAMVKPDAVSKKAYNHYSVLRTIEDNFSLGTLGRNDKTATPIEDIWK